MVSTFILQLHKARPLQVALFGDSVVYYYTPQYIIQQWQIGQLYIGAHLPQL